jgi:hypothetical protein
LGATVTRQCQKANRPSERRMDRNELWRSVLLILALLALVVLAAQSRRNCEVPGSAFVPCVSFKVLWNSMGR